MSALRSLRALRCLILFTAEGAKGLPKNKIAGILEIKPQINADERRFVVRY
jgi:hypothetical protein